MNSIGSISSVHAAQPISAAAARPANAIGGPSFADCLASSLEKLAANPAAHGDGTASSIASLARAQQAERLWQLTQHVSQRVTAAVDELKQIRV